MNGVKWERQASVRSRDACGEARRISKFCKQSPRWSSRWGAVSAMVRNGSPGSRSARTAELALRNKSVMDDSSSCAMLAAVTLAIPTRRLIAFT